MNIVLSEQISLTLGQNNITVNEDLFACNPYLIC